MGTADKVSSYPESHALLNRGFIWTDIMILILIFRISLYLSVHCTYFFPLIFSILNFLGASVAVRAL